MGRGAWARWAQRRGWARKGAERSACGRPRIARAPRTAAAPLHDRVGARSCHIAPANPPATAARHTSTPAGCPPKSPPPATHCSGSSSRLSVFFGSLPWYRGVVNRVGDETGQVGAAAAAGRRPRPADCNAVAAQAQRPPAGPPGAHPPTQPPLAKPQSAHPTPSSQRGTHRHRRRWHRRAVARGRRDAATCAALPPPARRRGHGCTGAWRRHRRRRPLRGRQGHRGARWGWVWRGWARRRVGEAGLGPG